MKKFVFVLCLCITLLLTGCGSKSLSTYTEISYDEFNRMVDDKKSFPLVIGSSTCSACSVFKPTMESFIKKYQVEVFYIDLSKLSEDDSNKLSSVINFKSTPTTVFFKDGLQTSVYHRLVGSESFSNVVDAYKRMGYIGE